MTDAERKTWYARGDTVFIGQYDEENIETLIKDLQNLLEAVPREYRDAAVLEIDSDESGLELQLMYKRPETDEEVATRLARDQKTREFNLAQARKRYETLKQQFEPSP